MSAKPIQITDGVWGVETQVGIGMGMELPLRMTVLRDAAGLVLVSPIDIDADLQSAIDPLGKVHTLLAPNRLHYRYLARAKAAYPDARLVGAPGLPEKCPELHFDSVARTGQLSPELDTFLVQGAEKMSEVVVLHKPSGTLVVTDLVFNINHAKGMTRWLLTFLSGAFGKVEQSRLCRSLTEDRSETARSVAQLLTLPFERVVPAHGDVIERRAREELSAGLWWMQQQPKRPHTHH